MRTKFCYNTVTSRLAVQTLICPYEIETIDFEINRYLAGAKLHQYKITEAKGNKVDIYLRKKFVTIELRSSDQFGILNGSVNLICCSLCFELFLY